MSRTIKIRTDQFDSKVKAEILINNACDGILPYSSYDDGNDRLGIFNTDGYIRLKDCEKISGIQALTVIELTVKNVEKLKDYLIFPDEYVISLDTIYVNEEFTNAKFLVIPAKKSCKECLCYQNIIIYLLKVTSEIGKEYVKKAWNYIIKAPKYSSLISYIEQLKSEIRYFETK